MMPNNFLPAHKIFHQKGRICWSITQTACLNVVVLKEQLNPVLTSDGKNSYFQQVSVAGGTSVNQIVVANREITKSGYVYIYVSNESKDFKVYFAVSRKTKWFGNNLKVTHVRGPLLSEEGYYPFGMTMSAISSTAGTVARNNYKFNAGTELTESFDINYYETYFRQYDAQLGRFTGVDALAEQTLSWSPYQFGYNNPAMFNDPMGLLSDAQWKDFLKRLDSGNFGEFGGYYKTGGSDGLTEFRSADEAFGFAAWEMNYTYGWGSYQGWATSFAHALSRYNGGKKTQGIMNGVVAAYFTNQWIGEASNVTASHSYQGGVDGFSISMTIGGTRWYNDYFVSENFIRGTFAFLNSLYNGQKNCRVNWWSIVGNINASLGVTFESTEQIVITSQRLANRFSGTTNRIIKGGGLTKNAGASLAVAGGLITIGDALTNGVQLHHAADLAIDAGIYALSASIPLAGWIIGGAWFLGNIAFQHYHNGQSITEYYLDK